jgi:hypothetical protein
MEIYRAACLLERLGNLLGGGGVCRWDEEIEIPVRPEARCRIPLGDCPPLEEHGVDPDGAERLDGVSELRFVDRGQEALVLERFPEGLPGRQIPPGMRDPPPGETGGSGLNERRDDGRERDWGEREAWRCGAPAPCQEDPYGGASRFRRVRLHVSPSEGVSRPSRCIVH